MGPRGGGGGLGRHSGEEDSGAAHRYDRRLFGLFWRFLRPFARRIALSVAISLGGAALELLMPQLVRKILDGPARSGDMAVLARLTAAYGFLIVVSFVFSASLMMLVNWTGQSAMLAMRRDLFGRLQEMDTRYFDKNPVGRLLTRVMNDVAALNEAVTEGIPMVFRDALILVGIVAILFATDWRLATVVFLCFPMILFVAWRFSRSVRRYYRQGRARLAAMNAFLQENISGMKVVQLFGREPKSMARFAHLNARYRESQIGTIFAFSLFFPAIELVAALSVSLILWHGGVRMIHHTITFGVLTAFILYTRRFFQPIRELAEKFNMIESALAAGERIQGLLDAQPQITDPPSPIPATPFRGRIEFDRVWFAYEDEEWVLRDLSFAVEKGQTIAVAGPTGAGKTTIISLLQRFYEPQRGSIRIDGVDIREMAQADLRRKMAVVLQDVFLFQGSVADNIRLGRPGLSDAEVRSAAETVHADSFVQRMENGYGQEILERGATLSVGQKQLLAFARALACSPEILILDEATSNIDTETERLIQDALARLLAGRTAIVIAHRLSTIRRTDKILVIHRGKLREQGTHEELLRQGGVYTRLCQMQYRDELAEETLR